MQMNQIESQVVQIEDSPNKSYKKMENQMENEV